MRRTCLDMVYEIAKQDPRVVFIGSDLGPGTLDEMKQEMPDRFFMEGVSEANVIGMAAGLAMEGYIPYVNTIATFITRRCYEQIAIDLCLHNLPVRLIGNGGGLIYAPLGPTHLAIEDIAIMRALPNMTICAPTDANEMRRLIPASLHCKGPVYIRLGKGGDPIVSRDKDQFEIGKAVLLRDPGDILIISTGIMSHKAILAADILAQQNINCGVLNMHTIKPLDQQATLKLAARVKVIITLEEHKIDGGLGSAVLECLIENMQKPIPVIKRLGLPDSFTKEYGSQDSMLCTYGLQANQIAAKVEKTFLANLEN